MAIYHFTVKVMSRANGRNAVAGATYRHGQSMTDDISGKSFVHTTDQDVDHCELSIPENAPQWAKDLLEDDVHKNSEKLWNAVEQFEKRVDARVYREVEFSLPHELNSEQRLELAREFIVDNFTAKGMIADWSVHNHFDKEEGIEKPHVHVMLTTREGIEKDENIIQKLKSYVGLSSKTSGIYFGPKVADWNSKYLLMSWREKWADCANAYLSKAGLDMRIDHRSYVDQGIELEPQPKLGKSVSEMSQRGLPMDRFEEIRKVQRKNRALIRSNPEIVLDYITRYQSTFTRQDIAKVLNRYIDNAQEFQSLLGRIEASPQLVVLTGNSEEKSIKLTTKDVIQLEKKIVLMSAEMGSKHCCPPHLSAIDWYIEKGHDKLSEHGGLSKDQVHAIKHMVSDGQLKVIVGYAGAGKTTCLEVAKEIWGSSGYKIVGAAPTGKAASNLDSIGIASKTLHKWEQEWANGREQLHNRSILILDEAGMVDSRRLHSLLRESKEKGFKIVLVGDPEQLSPIEAGAPTRAIMETVGFAELSTIVRQKVEWQRETTRDLATRQTTKALEAYHQNKCIHYGKEAKENLIKDWAFEQHQNRYERVDLANQKTSLILAYTNQEVRTLNQLARNEERQIGLLQGPDHKITVSKPLNLETLDKQEMEQGKAFKPKTIREERSFAIGEQIVFLKNDYDLNVRNGQLSKIVDIQEGFITVKNNDDKIIRFDTGTYNHIDYGYATTIHKSQGSTVDKVFVYASPYMDKNLTYVALTRHREDVNIYVNTDVIPNKPELFKSLSKEASKENALDYMLDNSNQSLDLSPEDKRAFMQRRSISSASPTYISWDSVKELTHKVWSQAKDWMFGEKQETKEELFSSAMEHSSTYSDYREQSNSRDYLKGSKSQSSDEVLPTQPTDPVRLFQDLLKESGTLPFILNRSAEQHQRSSTIESELEQLGHVITNDPILFSKAQVLNLEKFVTIEASAYFMKEMAAKEKTLDLELGRGMAFELSLRKD